MGVLSLVYPYALHRFGVAPEEIMYFAPSGLKVDSTEYYGTEVNNLVNRSAPGTFSADKGTELSRSETVSFKALSKFCRPLSAKVVDM